MSFLLNPYVSGASPSALATQASSLPLIRISGSAAQLAGINVGAAITNFAKTGNEILSSYPFYYSSDNGASFASVTTDLGSNPLESYMGTDGTNWGLAGRLSSAPTTFRVWRSTNRENWTGATLTGAGRIFGFAYGGGKWVVIAANSASPFNTVWYSSDLITWTNPTLPQTIGNPVAYGNGYFITVGTSEIWRAVPADLATWDNYAVSDFSGWSAVKIAYSSVNSRWVIVGVDGGLNKAKYSSDDGATWAAATVPSPTFTMSTINNVVALSGGGFMAVGITAGSLGAVIYSADGITWANITDAEDFQGLYGLVAL